MEAQLKACELSSVRAFVDVNLKKTSVLRRMLHDLGANVYLRNITHLIFWNGRQETLDKAHRFGNKISIISPHWVFKCFMNLIRTDEGPFLLYGVKDLAVPIRLMAMGRVGVINMSCHETTLNSSDSSLNESQIVHAIETLSDQLASKLTSSANNENIDVVEIISPIVDRVRKRLNETNILNCYEPTETPPCSDCTYHVVDGKNVSYLSLKNFENNYCQISQEQRRHMITRTSVFCGESKRDFTTPTTESSTSVKSIELMGVTQSEPVKRRGRPSVNSEQVAEYTPARFHKYLRRRCRSVRAEHAAQLNTEKMVRMYRKMMNQNFSTIISDKRKFSTREKVLKARPVVVRTRSSVLNDLQNVPSSNEFVKKKKIARKKVRSGNIVLSGISKIERETVFAITKKLGVLKIASTVDERTRYVVSDQEGVRTINVMRALVKGIPIVTIEWAYRSLEIGSWLKGSDFLVSRWKITHRAWIDGHMNQFEEEFRIVLQDIPKLQTTESLNRAVVFVAPQSQWEAFIQLRKDNDTQATYITEKSLLGTVNNLLTLSEMYEGRIFEKGLSLMIQYANAKSIFCYDYQWRTLLYQEPYRSELPD
ncbi:unnamed protein product [Litomosoides sigmodontis]|uniref:BRCT domain-containing protein n=1 Tax=Litomosoides sigmodontis TaxID=42156 RepID=A0A3P6S3U1_LITSI|nr:unnamed protein product [Litomosoides sigmodontis]